MPESYRANPDRAPRPQERVRVLASLMAASAMAQIGANPVPLETSTSRAALATKIGGPKRPFSFTRWPILIFRPSAEDTRAPVSVRTWKRTDRVPGIPAAPWDCNSASDSRETARRDIDRGGNPAASRFDANLNDVGGKLNEVDDSPGKFRDLGDLSTITVRSEITRV